MCDIEIRSLGRDGGIPLADHRSGSTPEPSERLPADTVVVPRPALEYLLEHFDVGTDRTALLAVTVLQYAMGRQIDGPMFPEETVEKAIDPSLPPGVIRVDGQPMPLVEFPDDPK